MIPFRSMQHFKTAVRSVYCIGWVDKNVNTSSRII